MTPNIKQAVKQWKRIFELKRDNARLNRDNARLREALTELVGDASITELSAKAHPNMKAWMALIHRETIEQARKALKGER